MKYIHVFLINSFTVKNDLDKLKNKIENYCMKTNIDYIIEVNGPELDTEDILKKYKRRKCIIVAIGGDGVINRTLNAIVGTKNILSIIPYGTGNDFYKSVKRDLEEGLNKIDICQINKKYFLNTACLGIDADVANNKSNVKINWLPKKYKYYISLVKCFFNYKSRRLKVEVNGRTYINHFTTIVICNGSHYGGSFNIGPKSNIRDGVCEVYLVPELPKVKMVHLILKMKKGKHEKSKNITKEETKRVYIKSNYPINANIDGELYTARIFSIKLLKEGIDLYYNKNMIKELTE